MIAVTDTETGGLDPDKTSIVELAVVELPTFETFSTLVKPSHPIELEALATHHISEEMVADAPDLESAITASRLQEADFIAAHNAAFDMGFLKIDKPIICTWRCARHLYPDAPRHSNQVLRYYLNVNRLLEKGQGEAVMRLPPHRALPDAWVTAHILQHMLEVNTPEELVELTKSPILIKKVGFGKHFGMEWKDVPRDYLKWASNVKDFDADVKYTVNHWLVHR